MRSKNFTFYHLLRFLLLIFSCGFYTLPVKGFENPAHPRDLKEIQEEEDEKNEQNRSERRILDIIDPENAPHSEEDRKNFVQFME